MDFATNLGKRLRQKASVLKAYRPKALLSKMNESYMRMDKLHVVGNLFRKLEKITLIFMVIFIFSSQAVQ